MTDAVQALADEVAAWMGVGGVVTQVSGFWVLAGWIDGACFSAQLHDDSHRCCCCMQPHYTRRVPRRCLQRLWSIGRCATATSGFVLTVEGRGCCGSSRQCQKFERRSLTSAVPYLDPALSSMLVPMHRTPLSQPKCCTFPFLCYSLHWRRTNSFRLICSRSQNQLEPPPPTPCSSSLTRSSRARALRQHEKANPSAAHHDQLEGGRGGSEQSNIGSLQRSSGLGIEP